MQTQESRVSPLMVWSLGIHSGGAAVLASATFVATLLFGSLPPCGAHAVDCRYSGGGAIVVPGLAATALLGAMAVVMARAARRLRRGAGHTLTRLAAAAEGILALAAAGGI